VQANATAEAEAMRKKKGGKKNRVKDGKPVEGGHTHCGVEGENCECSGVVTFVVDHNPLHSVMPEDNLGQPQYHMDVDGSIACSNSVFGDPAPGKAKHCVCSHAPYDQKFGLGKAKVHEGEEIECVGTVLYGHSKNGMFANIFKNPKEKKTYAKKRSYGIMKCSIENFGDVAPGMGNACWCDKDADLEPYVLEEGHVAEACGKEGEACNCTTTVHFGDGKAEDFATMAKKHMKTKEVSSADKLRGYTDCNSNVFGGDPLPNQKKQCFCERPEAPSKLKEDNLSKCGSEGDKCQCKGRVFYGRETDAKLLKKRALSDKTEDYLLPKEMLTFPYAEKEVNGVVDCTNDVFGEVARGLAKQCYCESEADAPKVEKCGLEGDECVCAGTVYYGRETIAKQSGVSFEQMTKKPYKTAQSHGSVTCNSGTFGGDPTPGYHKQCFCETGALVQKVLKCGDEGEDCQCSSGNIFFGAAVVDEKAADFEAMLTKNFKVKQSPA
jgi:hypothetical protein